MELISVRIRKFTDPFPPLHLLRPIKESDTLLFHSIILGLDVICEYRDSCWTRFYPPVRKLAEMDSSEESAWSDLNPVTRFFRKPLNSWVWIRLRWADIGRS